MIIPWQVGFLGGLRIYREGIPPVCRLRTAKTTALFAFLCAHVGRDQSRDELIERFWPELPFDAGRNSLRIALSALRRTLDLPDRMESVLIATRSHVRLLSQSVQTDVANLEIALRTGNTKVAAEIASLGAFLPGIYDEWVLSERERVEVLRDQAQSIRETRTAITESKESRECTVSGHLPLPLGRFFGRELEMAQLISQLLDPTTRLVTLVGPGGNGKTRLALETARTLREGKAKVRTGHPGNIIWFVPLSSITNAGHILSHICMSVGIDLTPDDNLLEALAQGMENLGSGRLLLILDNLEQIESESCATVLRALLERIPKIICLVTSRRRIGLLGERAVFLLPFTLPARDDDWESLTKHPAVALFADRAREADIDFALTPHRTPAIAELCTQLNGVPLALEMAASWAGIYTTDEMLNRIADDVTALPGRQAGSESRHKSLRSVAEWSIRLLPMEVQSLLACLSVFSGKWTLDAGERIAPDIFTPERLAILCDHSLVQAETQSVSLLRTFQIVPALRPFAEELLVTNVEAVRYRHAVYFTEKAIATQIHLENLPDAMAALTFLESEDQRINDALRLVGGLWNFWWKFGDWETAQTIVERVLSRVGEDNRGYVSPEAWSDALRCAGKLAFYQGDFLLARKRMQQRMHLEEQQGNQKETLHLRANLATLDVETGNFCGAITVFEEILPLLPELGTDWKKESGYIYNNYADALIAVHRIDDALRVTEDYLQYLQNLGLSRNGIAGLCWSRLASIYRIRSASEDALNCIRTSIEIFRECNEIYRIADGLLEMATICRVTGDKSGAWNTLRESFALRRRVPTEDGYRRSVQEAELLLTSPIFRQTESTPPPSWKPAFIEATNRLEEWGNSLK